MFRKMASLELERTSEEFLVTLRSCTRVFATQEHCQLITILNLQTRLFRFVPDVRVRSQKCPVSEKQSKHIHRNSAAHGGLTLNARFTMTPR